MATFAAPQRHVKFYMVVIFFFPSFPPLLLISRAACMYHDHLLSLSHYQVLSTKYAPSFHSRDETHYANPTCLSCCTIRHCRICFARERKITRLELVSSDKMEMALFTQFISS